MYYQCFIHFLLFVHDTSLLFLFLMTKKSIKIKCKLQSHFIEQHNTATIKYSYAKEFYNISEYRLIESSYRLTILRRNLKLM
jgi:hypothetical protein